MNDKNEKFKALASVNQRNQEVAKDRDLWRQIARNLSIGVVVLSVGLSVFAFGLFKPEREYFAHNQVGGLVKLRPLAEPTVTADAVRAFALEALVATFSFDFARVKEQVDHLESYYTRDGFSSIRLELVKIGLIDRIEKDYLVTGAVATAAPIIVAEGVHEGAYKWLIEVPVTMTMQSKNTKETQQFRLAVTVVRAQETEKKLGVAVDRVQFN